MSSGTSTRSHPQVPQTTGDTQYNVRDAALRGASTAFSKPPVKPKPQVNTYTGGDNGALLAATKVASPRHASPQTSLNTTSPLRRDWTGGSNSTFRPSPSPMQLASKSNSSSTLGVPDDHLSDRTPSPSNIAAKLAAARHSPLRPIHPPATTHIHKEKDANDRDVLPPAGSVSNVLANMNANTTGKQPSKRHGSNRSPSTASTIRTSSAIDNKPTDDTPIPPTTTLVKIFEQTRPKTPTNPPAEAMRVSQRVQPLVRSPKPQRKITLPPEPQTDVFTGNVESRSPPVKSGPKPRLDIPTKMDRPTETVISSNLRKDSMGVPPVKQKPAQLAAIKTAVPRPQPPAKRASRQIRSRSDDLTRSTSFRRRVSTSLSIGSNEDPSSPASFVSAKEEQEPDQEDTQKTKPSLPPPRRSATTKMKTMQPAVRAKISPPLQQPRTPNKVTSPLQVPEHFTPRHTPSALGSSPPSDTIYHSNYQRESVKKISQHMTGESLSSAIVGAALASSRNASPAPPNSSAPVLPARRHHHHHSPFSHNRSPSPPKATGKLRSTMRKEPSSSSEEDESERYKRKGTRVMGMRRKHPNKHHEGTRKRWRDIITERERKRYEGVWAANKGLYITAPSQPPPNDDSVLDVCSLVTKEIWMRSRLPEHELEEVWYLVDGRNIGRLRREEFVVGLWMIDQRLKGRKLPTKVSESVWGSVKGVGGVKVKVKK
ncbi:hypothetical protein B0J11DRAFT_231199 [Dendryphion nanum]|uniref:EH domain-containing protein n=1 Tax=Dendryphion nanum TaxID=256645 RepID=A0A9P9E7Z3_9PLEO|nr:hypothetical protein B0J11DRAFT_231199 [Dendryphion nanum]